MAYMHRCSESCPSRTNSGAGIQTQGPCLLKNPWSTHIFPNKSKTNRTICSNSCIKCQISACLHISMVHLKAFWINYFRSLRGSLIWLTNTPTVVTSHISNKCLMVTNLYHESAEHGVKQNHMCSDSKWDLTRPTKGTALQSSYAGL